MKLHQKVSALTVTAIAVSVISGMLTAGVASAAPYHANVTPDVSYSAVAAAPLIYYCEGNVCAGWTGSASNPDVYFHADEYNFYGHYELQTPNHKSYNTVDSSNGVGPDNNKMISGHSAGKGEYCGIAWELNGDGGFDQIGDVCFETSGLVLRQEGPLKS